MNDHLILLKKIIVFTCLILIVSCEHSPVGEAPIVDDEGRVLERRIENYYKGYDTLGNLIYSRGYADFSDWKGCVNQTIYRNKHGQEVKRIKYNFDKSDTLPCLIKDSADHVVSHCNYKNNKLISREIYIPIVKDGKVVGYELKSTQKY